MGDVISVLFDHYVGDALTVDSMVRVNSILSEAEEPQLVSFLWFGGDEPTLEGFKSAGNDAPKFLQGMYRFTPSTKPKLRIAVPMALWRSETSMTVGIFDFGPRTFQMLKEVHDNAPFGQHDMWVNCELMEGRFPKYAFTGSGEGSRLRQALGRRDRLDNVFEAARRELTNYVEGMRSKRVKP